MEKAIKAAVRLNECRDTAKRFFKGEYLEKVKPYRMILEQTMKANGLEVIPALMKVSETHVYRDSDIGQMMFMAAVLEILDEEKGGV